VHQAQPVEADHPGKLGECPRDPVRGAQVVAGCVRVLGVETDPDALRARGLQDAGDLLEVAPDPAARARAVLHQQRGTPGRAALDDLTERRPDLGQHRVETRAQVGAGVEDDPVGIEGVGELHVMHQGIDR